MALAREKLVSSTPTANARKVTPLYHQVYVVLRNKIQNGEYPADRPLPGEHQLAEDYGVSRVTIRHTLKNLEIDGYIKRIKGIGTFPLAQPATMPDRYNISTMLEPGRFRDASATVKTLAMGKVDAPAHIAKEFGRAGQVMRMQRLRSVKREPFTLLTVYLPAEIADSLPLTELRKEPALIVLERAGYYLARADQAITAIAADEYAARLLRVPVGSPLIAMTSLFSGKDDEALAVLEALFRPDVYEYQTAAVREGSGKNLRWTPVS